MPGLRAGQRRAIRDLGRHVRARAPQAEEASGLIDALAAPHIAAVVLSAGGDSASGDRRAVAQLTAALEAQTRAPDTIIELSAPGFRGPEDLSRSLRSRLLRDPAHARRISTRGTSGERVTPLWRGLERRLPEGFAGRHQWLWILTPDSLPAPDALEQLVERLLTVTDEETHSALQVVGAKQLHAVPGGAGHGGEDWPDRLVDVGLSSARSGEVVPTTEPMELDQGQYDGRDAVGAVSLHGMLVHAPLFGDLGGFDPTIGGDHAAARFADRAREVGAHVVVAPQARIRRLRPPRREQVHRLGGTLHLPAEQRVGQLRRRLAEVPPLATPLLWLGGWLAALLRLVGLTAVKAPDAGVGELVASARALLNVRALVHARRFAAQGRRAVLDRLRRDERIASARAARELVRDGRRTSRRLRLSAAAVRAERRRSLTAQTVAPQQGRQGQQGDDGAQDASVLAVGAGDGEFDQLSSRRSGDRLGLFLLLLTLTALSLLVHRGLLGAEAVVGGAALPVSETIGEVFAETTSLIATDGLGRLAAANPFDLVLLGLSVLSAGHASTVLVWLTILAMPLAALTAWAAAGVVTSAASTRVIAALLWVAVPTLHTAVGEGRLGAVVAHILLPLAVRVGVRAAGRRPAAAGPDLRGGASSWEHAAGAALLLAAVTAAAPILLLPTVLICLIAALRGGRTFWLIPLPSLALAAPMLGSAALTGQNVLGVLFSAPTRVLAADPAPLWQQLLGHSRAVDPAAGLSTGDSLDWLPELLSTPHWALRLMLVVGLPLLVLGLVGLLLPGPRSAGARAVAGALLLVLLVSAAAGVVAVGDDGVELTPAHAAPLVSTMMLCLLLGAARALDGLPRALPRAGSVAAPVLATLLVLSVVASVGSWAAPRVLDGDGSRAPLTAMTAEPASIEAGAVRQIPATAADQGEGPAALRTLVLTSSADGVVGELVSGSGRTLDSARSALSAGDAPLWTEPALLPTWLGGTGGAAVEEPVQGSVADLSVGPARTGQLISALITPGAAQVPALMEEMAVGFVVVDGPSDGALAEAVDTAAGLVAVGPTDRGRLWRADLEDTAGLPRAASMTGAATSWARLVDAEGTTLALLPAEGERVDVDLDALAAPDGGETTPAEAAEGPLHVQLATAPAAGWTAELDGEPLEATSAESGEGPPLWGQQFRLPETALEGEPEGELSGELVVEHRSVWRAPALIAVAAFLVLVALIAVPLPRRVRLLPVASRGELGDRPAARSGEDA